MPVRSVSTHGTTRELAPLLRGTIARLNRRLRQTRPLDELTQTQLSALTSIDLAGAVTPGELAEVERVQPPTMTGIVARLQARGLVQRTPHPRDRRQVVLSTTPQGRAMLAEHRRARDAWLAARLGELTADERETLLRAAGILDRLSRR